MNKITIENIRHYDQKIVDGNLILTIKSDDEKMVADKKYYFTPTHFYDKPIINTNLIIQKQR